MNTGTDTRNAAVQKTDWHFSQLGARGFRRSGLLGTRVELSKGFQNCYETLLILRYIILSPLYPLWKILIKWTTLKVVESFLFHGGLPQDGLTPSFWSYIPSMGSIALFLTTIPFDVAQGKLRLCSVQVSIRKASFLIFVAAFMSRSWVVWQCSQVYVLTSSGKLTTWFIAFPVRKRCIIDVKKLNQQRFSCTTQAWELIYKLHLLNPDSALH